MFPEPTQTQNQNPPINRPTQNPPINMPTQNPPIQSNNPFAQANLPPANKKPASKGLFG